MNKIQWDRYVKAYYRYVKRHKVSVDKRLRDMSKLLKDKE